MQKSLNLKVGDWVEIRSKEEILRTLDKSGRLDGLPFMPQMFQYCGKRLQVFRSAHKTCDTVFPVRGRKVSNAVHLETRCDGQAYGGCQAACLLFWKEAWLKRAGGPVTLSASDRNNAVQHFSAAANVGCTEQDVLAGRFAPGPQDEKNPAYACQATLLPYYTTDLPWWDFRQYLQDLRTGNAGIWQMIKGGTYGAYYSLSVSRRRLTPIMRWFYDTFHPLWRGTLFPRSVGTIPPGEPTPTGSLNLQPGELVRVKSHKEILATLNTESKNRGLFFDAEMVPFCGGTYRVLRRVTQILDEKTGKMMQLKGQPIILEGVYCQSRYSYCRMFCPRAIYSYWRELWLERVSEPAVAPAKTERGKALESSRP